MTLTRPARVTATVETTFGRARRDDRGPPAARRPVHGALEGHDARRPILVYGGLYKIRFRATNELGAVELVTPAFRVIRAAPVPVEEAKAA